MPIALTPGRVLDPWQTRPQGRSQFSQALHACGCRFASSQPGGFDWHDLVNGTLEAPWVPRVLGADDTIYMDPGGLEECTRMEKEESTTLSADEARVRRLCIPALRTWTRTCVARGRVARHA